jgi:hypothetical protein
MKRIVTVIAAVLALQVLSSCTPAEVAIFKTLNPTDQAKVIKAVQDRQHAFFVGVHTAQSRPTDCLSAMRQVFPASTWNWGTAIIMRESGNNPSAQNPSSTAAGCWQMLRMHDHRYYSVGCTPAQKYDALCNTKAAYTLYQAAGTSPWRLY